MRKYLRPLAALTVMAVVILSAAGTVLAGGMENEDFLNNYGRAETARPGDQQWETVERLVLLSRTGVYEFTGEDAAADGTVTMELGNTYNFTMEKTAQGDDFGGSGITVRANENASFLPLDNEGNYFLMDYDALRTEHVEFINVSLYDRVKQDEYMNGGSEGDRHRSPSFSLCGRVVCTMTFEAGYVYHVGDGNISSNEESVHYEYMADAEPLEKPVQVTYTITIDGISNGVYREIPYMTTAAASGVGYNRQIAGNGGDAVYTIDIDVDGKSTHYDLMDPDERIRWLSVDIKFDIDDWSLTTIENEAYVEYPAEETPMVEHYEYHEYHESGFRRAGRVFVAAACAAVLGLLGCAVSNSVAGIAGVAESTDGAGSDNAGSDSAGSDSAGSDNAGSDTAESGDAEDTPDLPEEDTEGISVSLEVNSPDLINEKGAAVTVPIQVSGGENAVWHYIVKAVSEEAPKAVIATAAGDQAVLALTGDLNGGSEAEVTLFATAWSLRSDGTVQKGSAAEELTIHAEGITARRENGALSVTLCTKSRLKGVAELSEVDSQDYEVTDGMIRMKSEPYYTCRLPEEPENG